MLTVAIAQRNIILRGLMNLTLLDQRRGGPVVLHNESRSGWGRSDDLLQGRKVWVDSPRWDNGRCCAGDEAEAVMIRKFGAIMMLRGLLKGGGISDDVVCRR